MMTSKLKSLPTPVVSAGGDTAINAGTSTGGGVGAGVDPAEPSGKPGPGAPPGPGAGLPEVDPGCPETPGDGPGVRAGVAGGAGVAPAVVPGAGTTLPGEPPVTAGPALLIAEDGCGPSS